MAYRSKIIFVFFVIAGVFSSCSAKSSVAVLWTDRPEFVFYADQFNAAHANHWVEARYLDFPALSLQSGGELPDMVVASWLMNSSTLGQFQSLNNLFKKNSLTRDDFYPELLAMGSSGGKQYLLPVSFNLPALFFPRDHEPPPEHPFEISFEEIIEMSKAFNRLTGRAFNRMGFSPLWNDEFLYLVAVLHNADFMEADPVAFDAAALELAALTLADWVDESNVNIAMAEDFNFKYLYAPGKNLVSSGRILFAFTDSSSYFTMPEPQRSSFDFRWISKDQNIPVKDDAVFFGIHKKGRSNKTAEAFTQWFFSAQTQESLLEIYDSNHMIENSFGIAGGFSSMHTVNEQVLPVFYPDLEEKIPHGDYLFPPNTLPVNWVTIQERFILPYLNERVRQTSTSELRPLEQRIDAWYRLNRGR